MKGRNAGCYGRAQSRPSHDFGEILGVVVDEIIAGLRTSRFLRDKAQNLRAGLSARERLHNFTVCSASHHLQLTTSDPFDFFNVEHNAFERTL